MAIHAYYHKAQYQQQVLHEVPAAEIISETLVVTRDQPLKAPLFALDVWPDCELISIDTINGAIQALKARKLRWYHYPTHSIRRGSLIDKALAKPSLAPFSFPIHYNNRFDFGIFTLLSERQLLLCKAPLKRVPLGHYEFIEDKVNPPNRAYLKLWEALSLMNCHPQEGELCLDLGAAPGGWTWVLSQFKARVIAVDKAPLIDTVGNLSNVEYQQQSAFALNPADFATVDWLCSDVICYPERLLKLIELWLCTGKVARMICTIKLQGQEDWQSLQALQAIPQAKIFHLYQNKHELTWIYNKSI